MNEFQIEAQEIEEKTPFELVGAGRAVPQALFYDPDFYREGLPDYVKEQDWHLFHPGPDGSLTILNDAQAYKATYFGVESASDEDIQMPFFNLYYQHASFPNIIEYFGSIQEDIHNLAACISKIGVYQYLGQETNTDINHYILTELEYIISTCRSIYDTLHEIAKESWKNIQMFDGGQNQLPNKLSSMVLDHYDPVDSEELIEKYGIHEEFAEYYEDLAEFLSKVKYHRDSVHHYGGSFKTIFLLEQGVAVDTEREPYSEFDSWDDEDVNEQGLAPIWPFVAHLIGKTIEFMNRLPESVFHGVALPGEIAPGYSVFLTGSHIQNLGRINELSGGSVWGEPVMSEVASKMNSS